MNLYPLFSCLLLTGVNLQAVQAGTHHRHQVGDTPSPGTLFLNKEHIRTLTEGARICGGYRRGHTTWNPVSQRGCQSPGTQHFPGEQVRSNGFLSAESLQCSKPAVQRVGSRGHTPSAAKEILSAERNCGPVLRAGTHLRCQRRRAGTIPPRGLLGNMCPCTLTEGACITGMGICPVSCFGREPLWQGCSGHGDKTRLGLFSRRAVLHNLA